jgi:hypothetical protein
LQFTVVVAYLYLKMGSGILGRQFEGGGLAAEFGLVEFEVAKI